jgi:hypothetical protein
MDSDVGHRQQTQLLKESPLTGDSPRRFETQCASIVNLIPMKWMKVIHTLKNRMSQEFEHCSESQLIEVMNLKMQTTQFGVIVNLIQMKWMKMIYIRKNMMNQEFQYHKEL